MTNVAAHIALNRRLRALYVAAQRLANEAADGAVAADVKVKAETLRRQLDAIKSRALHARSLFRNRAQFVQSFALDDANGAAFAYVATMTPAALRGFIPHVIARFNSGEPNARSFAAAIVNQLEGLDEKSRPMSSARFADLLTLPDFDTLSVNASESFALVDAIGVVSDQLATSGALSAQGRIAIGLGVKDLRSADQLTEEDATHFDMPENADATTTDDTQPGGAGDGDGSNSGGEAGADNANDSQAEDAGGDDSAGENGGGAEGSGGESEAVA